jgi:cytochrome c5
MVSGSDTIMGAQAAFAASAAGFTSTTGEQAERARTEAAAAATEQRARTYPAAFVCCIDQAYRGEGIPKIGRLWAWDKPLCCRWFAIA